MSYRELPDDKPQSAYGEVALVEVFTRMLDGGPRLCPNCCAAWRPRVEYCPSCGRKMSGPHDQRARDVYLVQRRDDAPVPGTEAWMKFLERVLPG